MWVGFRGGLRVKAFEKDEGRQSQLLGILAEHARPRRLRGGEKATETQFPRTGSLVRRPERRKEARIGPRDGQCG